MRRFIFVVLVLFALSMMVVSAADQPRWLALNPMGDTMEVFDAGLKTLGTFQSKPRPFSVHNLPDQTGSALLYLGSMKGFGSMKEPGGILYLDTNLKSTGKTLPFSGLVIDEFYQPETFTWFIFTNEPSGRKTKNNILNIVNLKTGVFKQVTLTSEPSFYKLKDQNQLAIATTGNPEAKIKPELTIFDLTTLKTDTYPLTSNPGAIYFMENDKLLVACGGYRDNQKAVFSFISNAVVDPSASEPATLHLIDSDLKTTKSIPVGYAPLAIIQDQTKRDIFYLTSNTEPHPAEPSGMLQVLTGETITSQVKFNAEPVSITQAATGNLCVLGREEFILINPTQSKIISQLHYELRPEELRLSNDGKFGYITNVNSNFIDVIQLTDGSRQTKMKIGRDTLLGSIKMSNLLPKSYPPVIGMQERLRRNPESASTNNRMFFPKQTDVMYVLAGNPEVDVVDLKTNTVKNSIEFKGNAHGMHLTPNSKYIVVATRTYWYLIDPDKREPVLKVLITTKDDQTAPETGYYSPDGKLLIIPFEKTLFVIDTDAGKFLGKVKTKIENPVIAWTR